MPSKQVLNDEVQAPSGLRVAFHIRTVIVAAGIGHPGRPNVLNHDCKVTGDQGSNAWAINQVETIAATQLANGPDKLPHQRGQPDSRQP